MAFVVVMAGVNPFAIGTLQRVTHREVSLTAIGRSVSGGRPKVAVPNSTKQPDNQTVGQSDSRTAGQSILRYRHPRIIRDSKLRDLRGLTVTHSSLSSSSTPKRGDAKALRPSSSLSEGISPTLGFIEALAPSRAVRSSEEFLTPSRNGDGDLATTTSAKDLAAKAEGKGCIEAPLTDEPASVERIDSP